MGVSQKNGTPKSSIKKYGFPLFLPSILGGLKPLFLETSRSPGWTVKKETLGGFGLLMIKK